MSAPRAPKVNCKAFQRSLCVSLSCRKRAPHSVTWEREIERERVSRLFVHAARSRARRRGATRLFHYLRQESYLIVRPWRSASVLFLSFEHVLQLQAHTRNADYIFATLNCISIIDRMSSRINFYRGGNEPFCLIKEWWWSYSLYTPSEILCKTP